MEIRIESILCPVDFSENSDHALRYAVVLAKAQGARIELLHVIVPPVAAMPGDAYVTGYPADMLKEFEDNVEKSLSDIADRLSGENENLKVAFELRTGIPFLEIIREAKNKDISLIVMGTHGRTGLAHMLIGSVAEKVVRKATCPVLTVKHPEHEFSMP